MTDLIDDNNYNDSENDNDVYDYAGDDDDNNNNYVDNLS